MKVDYLVVGSGLAGILFCEVLRKHNKSFVILDDNSQKSSVVAGGLYNPVILKRFSSVWKSKEQLEIALPMYKELENYLNIKLDSKIPVYRLFNSVEEQNNWFNACDKPKLSMYLKPKVINNKNKSVNASYGYGEVLNTGRIDTSSMISAYKAKLSKERRFLGTSFDYNKLVISEDEINYNELKANQIVFAEGFGLKENPFFNYLPLDGTKGELLIIHAPDLNIDFVLKSAVFIIPIGEGKYIVGATYEFKDKTNTVTKSAREELLTKLDSFINCKYTVVNQVAAIRPTVKDRRPLIGQHQKHKNLYVLNGLGTRGVMIAPYVATKLFQYIENGEPLDSEINIKRFD